MCESDELWAELLALVEFAHEAISEESFNCTSIHDLLLSDIMYVLERLGAVCELAEGEVSRDDEYVTLRYRLPDGAKLVLEYWELHVYPALYDIRVMRVDVEYENHEENEADEYSVGVMRSSKPCTSGEGSATTPSSRTQRCGPCSPSKVFALSQRGRGASAG